ncbi:molecular chaperone DnaJ [Candidatus Woesearchaeota archaeon]|nr:molecular chaperone DnaJ [Candidatus Woesearchaeota archaeon]
MTKDYYKILGLDKSATKDDIKKAYKKLAKKHHPDINKEEGSAEKFKEVSEAAAVLGDDQKRQQYDQFGTADFSGFQGGAGGFDFSDFMRGAEGFGFDFDSIFDSFFGGSMFGGGRRRRGPQRGSDLIYDIEIDLKEAAFGTGKNITVPKMVRCGKCDGKGADSESDIIRCPDCNGTGTVKQARRTPFGMFQTVTTCRKCHGEGTTIKNPCKECDGSGLVEETSRIKVDIPAGVDNGTRLRISGEGEAGPKGGPAGDLFVRIHVRSHKIFERRGNDLFMDMPVSFSTAALGGEIDVPTLDGKAKMKIPSGTECNTVFRLKGKGIPSLRSYGTGDQKVRVIVDVPSKLSKKQKELLKEFDKESRNVNKSFFEKIKGSF